MATKCKKNVYDGWKIRPCSRTARFDGFCRQHHPDSIAKRHHECDARQRKEVQEVSNSPMAHLAQRNIELETRVKELEKENNEIHGRLQMFMNDER